LTVDSRVLFGPFVLSILLIGLGVPLAAQRVRPNGVYGYRTLKTMSNPDVWYPANAYAGRAMIVAGVATLILSLVWLVLIRWRMVSAVQTLVATFVITVVPLPIAAFSSWIYVSRLSSVR